ncbi:phage tail tube protein [Chitinimonas sp. PSY-7]|uniref:phage tail tube protein n=1 Tax=Chitinimonas sp. PSY-7 TaxID=3459088 RepID=UPI00404015BE
MPIASGIAKQVRYKVETAFNTPPGTAGSQLVRRVESSIDITKDTYQSNELRADYQIADYRHGTRKSGGTLKGELSPKTYADFIAAALRRDFAVVPPMTGAAITIAAVGSGYTLTRGAGSFLADGLKIGDVVRLTEGGFKAANLNKNLLVIGLTPLAATVTPLNGAALVAEGPIASATLVIVGKKTYTPASGHTDKSFAIEHWYADLGQSELYTGLKVSSLDISLPPTGMATLDIGFMGAGSIKKETAPYFVNPAAATSTGIVAAVNGVLTVSGVAVAVCTGLSIKVDGGYSGDPVVGSNAIPGIFAGRVNVSGQLTAYFDSTLFRDAFLDETDLSLTIVLTTDNSPNADFISLTLPRIKLGGATRSDGEKGIVVTAPFQALLNATASTYDPTTMVVQDSQA